MKKVLVVAGCNPHSIARLESANAGAFYVTRGLAEDGYDVTYLRAGNTLDDWPSAAMVQKEELEAAGVKFLPDLQYIKRPAYPSRLRRIFGMLAGDPKVLCQGAQYADDFKQAIGDYHPDLIVTVWSEMPTTMLYSSPFPVFAFYGNPDEKVAVAHIYANIALHKAWRKPKHWMDLAKSIIGLALFWPAHRKVIKSLAGIANNSFHDKDFYNYTGVSNTSHVRNMLEVDRSFEWCPRRDKTEQVAPLKIIGSAGLMSATGNTIGLEVIATRILPELKKSLGEGNFEIHLFGSGEPLPFLKPLLDDPHIKIRGFVKDLEEEILSAPVFLVANGFHPLFHMGNSRILHGWALGACMVVFDGTRDAMPEMVDGYNALLGKTPEEITWQIIRAGKDKTLRRRIGQNGYDTVTTLFDPKIVVTDLIKKIEIATSDMNSAPAVENRQE